MQNRCSTLFFQSHLILLPKFLKFSPLARLYFGVDSTSLLKSSLSSEINYMEFKYPFLNPFDVDEKKWLDDFVFKTKLFHSDLNTKITIDVTVNVENKFVPKKDKIYVEIDNRFSENEVLSSLRMLLRKHGQNQFQGCNYEIVEVNHQPKVLELCLKAAILYESGLKPKQIARELNLMVRSTGISHSESVGGVYASMMVRKCINIADNAFLGKFISEKKVKFDHIY